MTRDIHVIVHGRVQGVGYRYAARAAALRLGIAGWVRNRADGTVEAELRGTLTAVDAMLDWMATGPPGAGVARLDISDAAASAASGFDIRPSD
ncbi:acylphosphatase [Microbacterium sp. 18062]|uniref:acylphosphatase n=1 Tax=Microbacterium sp. 18062 TaxID=2681410 RepID=UPI001359993B|nr:acylphosphatase [Microbacterium sp. 18062]